MAMTDPDVQRMQAAVAASLHQHWALFLTEGIVLLVLGIIAILLPPIATLAVEIVIGWVLLLSGIVGLISTFQNAQRTRILVVAVLGPARNRCRSGAAALAAVGRDFAHLDPHDIPHTRRGCLDHVGLHAQPRFFGALGFDAGERPHRSHFGGHHLLRPAGDRGLGDRSVGGHQSGVRRHRTHLHGAARPHLPYPQARSRLSDQPPWRSARSVEAMDSSQSRNSWTSRRVRCARSGATTK